MRDCLVTFRTGLKLGHRAVVKLDALKLYFVPAAHTWRATARQSVGPGCAQLLDHEPGARTSSMRWARSAQEVGLAHLLRIHFSGNCKESYSEVAIGSIDGVLRLHRWMHHDAAVGLL